MLRVCFLVLIAVLASPACTSPGKSVAEIKDARSVGDKVSLPAASLSGSVSVEEALLYRRSVKLYKDADLTLSQISQLLWAAQGITAEKKGGRTAPSAGASYPLEVYCLWQNSLWHYLPESHSLELRMSSLTREQVAGVAHASAGSSSRPRRRVDRIIRRRRAQRTPEAR